MAVDTFLSYSHDDRRLAADVKRELENYGFEVFLAHEDIQPAREWQHEIFRRLQGCDVFVALLTDAFEMSPWTNQEVGIAYGRGGCILAPISADGRAPRGFLGRFQAVPLGPGGDGLRETCWRIVRSVAGQSARLAQEIRRQIVNKLADAVSFDEAGLYASRLEEIDGVAAVTLDEMNELLDEAASNGEVRRSGSASGPLHRLIAKYEGQLNQEILARFRRRWTYA